MHAPPGLCDHTVEGPTRTGLEHRREGPTTTLIRHPHEVIARARWWRSSGCETRHQGGRRGPSVNALARHHPLPDVGDRPAKPWAVSLPRVGGPVGGTPRTKA